MRKSFQLFLTTFGRSLVAAVDAAAARTQLGFTSTGSALATATDQAAGRTALGLGTIATQNANTVAITGGTATLASAAITATTASTASTNGALVVAGGLGVGGNANIGGQLRSVGAWFGGGLLNDFYAANNFFAYGGFNVASVNIVPTQERLQGALSFGIFSSTNVTNAERAVNHSYDSFATINAGQTGIFEFDFGSVLSARGDANVNGLLYESGTMFVTFYNDGKPGAFTVEAFAHPQGALGLWDWRVIASVANMDTAVGSYRPYILKFPSNTWQRIQKIRITATALASKACNITAIEYFPSRASGNELLPFVTTKNNSAQAIYCPSFSVRSRDHIVAATVGQGIFTPYGFTVSELTTGVTGQANGSIAFCTNDIGGPIPVFFDGTNWRRMSDRAVISTT